MAKKGQTSMELIITIAFTLFIFIIVALFASEKNRESNDFKIKIDTKRICKSVADNINNIAEQGSGFYRYFSLPRRVYGEHEYNISIYGNWVEISLEDHHYTRINQIVTSNVTVFCLDKGLNKRNKIFNDRERIFIICHKPELMMVNGSFHPVSALANESINVSIDVINFGPVDCGQFRVLFNNTILNNTVSVVVPSLKSEEVAEVWFNMTTPETTGYYPIEIKIDVNNSVNESIESNNFYNGTLNVV